MLYELRHCETWDVRFYHTFSHIYIVYIFLRFFETSRPKHFWYLDVLITVLCKLSITIPEKDKDFNLNLTVWDVIIQVHANNILFFFGINCYNSIGFQSKNAVFSFEICKGFHPHLVWCPINSKLICLVFTQNITRYILIETQISNPNPMTNFKVLISSFTFLINSFHNNIYFKFNDQLRGKIKAKCTI